MNPFSPLYRRCSTGSADQKHGGLGDGPIIIDVEPVSLCNFRCTMCPTGLQALGRPGGMMTDETFDAIIEKTEPFGTAIRMIGWGEPLMHPKIVEFIERAALAGRLTHINTNGSHLDETMAQKLVDAGLSSIKFSFQGVDRETYADMRRIDFFDGMIEAIEMMRAARGAHRLPWIAASTTTTTETPEQIDQFRLRMLRLVDDLTIGSTIFEFIDMAAVPVKRRAELETAAANQQVTKRHPDPCPEVWDKLSIHWDGTVVVCCNSYGAQTDLGNIATDDFAGIWRHPTIEEYRARLARKEYGGPLCSVCFDYMKLSPAKDTLCTAKVTCNSP